MSSLFIEIRPDNPQNNPEELAAQLDNQLVAMGAIGILDLKLEKRQLFKTPLLTFTLAANDPGPLQFRATYFSQDQGNTTDLDTQYNAFFAADATRRAFYIFDVSSELRRSTNRDALIVVYTTSAASNFNANNERVLIVQPTANILAGASGDAQIVSSGGLLDTISVINRSSFVWTAGDRGYASISNTQAGFWDGYQICCNAP